VDAKEDDASIGPGETEIGYYQGEGLLLEDVLKEQLLLALPVKLLCRANCKGLCPHCGRNLMWRIAIAPARFPIRAGRRWGTCARNWNADRNLSRKV